MPALICLAFTATACVKDQQLSAGKDLYTAATISDDELIQVSREMRGVGDKENQVATGKNKYAQRLARLTDKLKSEDGLELNFKACVTKEVNANATADGSIRVYSGLMDLMNDNELLFVTGHEIGQVKTGTAPRRPSRPAEVRQAGQKRRRHVQPPQFRRPRQGH